MNRISDVRPSPIAGQWYPGDPKRLSESVDRYLDAARLPELQGEVVAVVAPHAGHLYSGPVAGYAFAALRGRTPAVVIVASPMHYPYFEPLLTSAHQAYRTPLGLVEVNVEALKELDGFLLQELGFGLTRVANDSEHSLEIELPFLQRALSGPFTLVPVMVRDQSERVARGLGHSFVRLQNESKALAGKETLLVASTDLSHFFPQAVAEILDGEMLGAVGAFDPEGVIRTEEEEKGFACGRGALAAVMFAARELGADQAKVLHYATSGDVSGDYDRVVGYAAVAVTRSIRQQIG